MNKLDIDVYENYEFPKKFNIFYIPHYFTVGYWIYTFAKLGIEFLVFMWNWIF